MTSDWRGQRLERPRGRFTRLVDMGNDKCGVRAVLSIVYEVPVILGDLGRGGGEGRVAVRTLLLRIPGAHEVTRRRRRLTGSGHVSSRRCW